MTTSSVLALGTPSFSSSVPAGLPYAFLAKGGFWVSLLVAFVVADLQVGPPTMSRPERRRIPAGAQWRDRGKTSTTTSHPNLQCRPKGSSHDPFPSLPQT
jgi:hypothetical protein